jgi:fimbrial chaperone protein
MKPVPARRHLMALLLAGVLGGPSLAGAAGLTIAPVLIEIDQPRRAVAVVVTNTSTQPVTLQAASLLWQQVNGRDETTPSDDLLVVPAIAKVAPNASQVFRVALRRPVPAGLERSYRLLLEDISEDQKAAAEGAAGSGISIRLSHSLPVMVAPSGKVVNAVHHVPCATPAASQSAASPAQACVRLVNNGNRRIKIDALTVAGEGWEQRIPISPAVNVLAGAAREWRLPLESPRDTALSDVKVHLSHGPTLSAEPGASTLASRR